MTESRLISVAYFLAYSRNIAKRVACDKRRECRENYRAIIVSWWLVYTRS